MSIHHLPAACLLLAAFGAATAQQGAKPEPAKAESAKAESAKAETDEAKAAMERAQRMAANPLKVILQAGKIKRKVGEGEGAPEPVEPASVRRTAVRTGAAADAPVAAAPAPRPVATSAPAPANTASNPPAVAVAAPPPAVEPPPAKVIPATLLASSATAAELPSLEAAKLMDAAPIVPKSVPMQALQSLPITAEPVRPTLVAMVEPEIPPRLLNEAGRVSEVLADLSLRPDGTVAAVTVLPPAPRQWQRYIVAALEKWRFEPLPSARTHRVQLVFDDSQR